MGYYESVVRATKIEDYLDNLPSEVLFDPVDLHETIRNLAERVIALENAVASLKRKKA